MKARCLRVSHQAFESYAGRGITIDPRWLEFQNFYADMGNRPSGKSLERRENDKGYCKDNCYWATPKEQALNRRDTVFVTFRGKHVKLFELVEALCLNYTRVRQRLFYSHWPLEKALFEPVQDSRFKHRGGQETAPQ